MQFSLRPKVWYQFTFDVKEGYSLLLDIEGMD